MEMNTSLSTDLIQYHFDFDVIFILVRDFNVRFYRVCQGL
jgi:hypothetical protein